MAGEKKLFDEETQGDLEGEFIKMQEGLRVRGVLERAFCTEGQYALQGAYGIRGTWDLNNGETGIEKPEMILVGERPFFADAIRELKIGTYVELTFDKKEAYGKGEREMWKGTLRSARDGKGVLARVEMNDYFRRRILPTRATKKEADAPF